MARPGASRLHGVLPLYHAMSVYVCLCIVPSLPCHFCSRTGQTLKQLCLQVDVSLGSLSLKLTGKVDGHAFQAELVQQGFGLACSKPVQAADAVPAPASVADDNTSPVGSGGWHIGALHVSS